MVPGLMRILGFINVASSTLVSESSFVTIENVLATGPTTVGFLTPLNTKVMIPDNGLAPLPEFSIITEPAAACTIEKVLPLVPLMLDLVAAPDASNPVGKLITIFPLTTIGLVGVKIRVMVPVDAPAAK